MEVTPELLKKYSNGDCSDIEIKAVETWLEVEGGVEDEHQEVIISSDTGSNIWNKIKETKKHIPRHQTKKLKPNKVLAIVASVLILIGITTYLTIINSSITYSTGIGELKTILLKDGTKITLNSATTLKLSNKFNTENRKVTLDGEAFFEVAKDSLHPFTITTMESVTKVLGTKFNLSAYQNENNKLTLKEGKVLFYQKGLHEDMGVILTPKEQIVIKDDKLTKSIVNPEKYSAWVYHQFIFENEPFVSIARKMERKYGISIRIEREDLKKAQYRGTYKKPTLKTLLEDLSFVLKFNYTHNEKEIIIY
ncbi:FecR family protein [Flavivirga sp. 57AJ16]|uniref:FecR family protein n=1 Tax=Flavivirga sp. 57AJ16 TaxID=3025307 RepID=UPI002366BFEB|nr:FecR family protein [Flavivirga sp. 57AJ16]MDD7886948.1 FecR family protein [Flavivirga sp. 57AJ16]